MKTIKNLLSGIIATLLLLTSCMSFDEMNTDPTRLNTANPGTFLNPVLYGMASYNWSRYNGYTFALMQCIVSTSSTNGIGWYYINDNAGDGTWNTYYRWLNNIKEMEKTATELNEPNYQAVALVLKSWIYQLLCDSFGDVPMTEACRGDEGILSPRFDTQQDIYRQILLDLDIANKLFDTKTGLKYNQEGELLYNTSGTDAAGIQNWKKFCNSLRMRMLLRVLSVPEYNSAEELKKMLNDPETYPVFTSNADAALLQISGVAPELAPMTRPQDFTSYKSVSEFFVNTLLEWQDPRLPIFATKATNGDVTSYVGMPSGYLVLPEIKASGPNQGICKAPMKLALMSYAELEFIKTELAQRQIISIDAGESYRKAVQAAIEQWGGVMPDTYFDNPAAAYDGTLERIMKQKFFALFFCDYQQWFEHNRTGLPEMPRGEGVPPANYMPARFKYPAILQRTNMKNYQIAKDQMGGDDFNIKLMWQNSMNQTK